MSTVVKQGAKSAATEKAKSSRVVTPKLICIITGASRFTNKEYLDAKAAAAGSRKRFLEHYVSSDAMKLLREGKTVSDIRTALKVKPEDIKEVGTPSAETLKVALEINGKRAKKPKAAKPAKAAKTPATPRKPKAPAAPKSTPGTSQQNAQKSEAPATPATTPSGSTPTTPAQ